MKFLAAVHTLLVLALLAMLALTFSAPFIAIGVWMLVLGRAARRGDRGLRPLLLRTHGVLLVLAFAAMAVGTFDLRAAERSAQYGGGLLGGLALIPLGLGAASPHSVSPRSQARSPSASPGTRSSGASVNA